MTLHAFPSYFQRLQKSHKNNYIINLKLLDMGKNLENDYQLGVFHRPNLSVNSLKESAFLWEHIYIYPSLLESRTLSDNEISVDSIINLFDNNILKIVDDAQDLKRTFIHDYKYAVMFDENIRGYILDNSSSVFVAPKLPQNHEDLIRATASIDEQDEKLEKIRENEWQDAEMYQLKKADEKGELRIPLNNDISKMVLKNYFNGLKEVRNNILKNSPYNYIYDNKILLDQLSVSSSIYIEPWKRPYFEHKINRFSEKDATKSLRGMRAVTPFIDRNRITDFSLDEIIEIRKMNTWKGAMRELSDLCNEAKFSQDTTDFEESIKNKIVFEYQDLLDEKRASVGGIGKGLIKSSVFNGISFIPIVGPIVSTVASYMDPLVQYLFETKSQKNLPVFLSEVRKNK